MHVLYFVVGAALVGMTLGLLGSGGSILTVPILVYLLQHDRNVAIGEGLAIVGTIALAGALPYARARRIVWTRVFYFGLPGILGAMLGVELGSWLSGALKLLLLALIMFASAAMMFRTRSKIPAIPGPGERRHALTPRGAILLMAQGLAVGMMTGVVGVGGGFLIVPALVLLGNLGMHLAVGTSLMIIFLNSGIGFMRLQYKLTENQLSVDWQTILWFALIGIGGALLGGRLNKRLPQARLRQGFAVLLLVLGSWIVIREAPQVLGWQPSPSRTSTQAPISFTPSNGTYVR